jgi:hypothetical protein
MSPETVNWATQWTDIAISTLRKLGAFANRWLPPTAEPTGEKHWILDEKVKRLVIAWMSRSLLPGRS